MKKLTGGVILFLATLVPAHSQIDNGRSPGGPSGPRFPDPIDIDNPRIPGGNANSNPYECFDGNLTVEYRQVPGAAFNLFYGSRPDDPSVYYFLARHSINVENYLNNINEIFKRSDLWQTIEASGDCSRRFDDPSAYVERQGGAGYVHLTISFRMKQVACDGLYPGSRIDLGSARYSFTVAIFPQVKYGSVENIDGVDIHTDPSVGFKAYFLGSNFQTSEFVDFFWKNIGVAIFNQSSPKDVHKYADNQVSRFLENSSNLSLDRLMDENFGQGLDSAFEEITPDFDVDSEIALRYFEAFKPNQAMWFPDYYLAATPQNQMAIAFDRASPMLKPEDLSPPLPPGAPPPPLGPPEGPPPPIKFADQEFEQKRSIMCEIQQATTNYIASRTDLFRIIQLRTVDGLITDEQVLRRMFL